jgi:hypothetical protein
MKNTMKLCLMMTPLLCASLYSAEKPTSENCWGPIIAECAAKLQNLDPEDPANAARKFQREITNQETKKMAKTMTEQYVYHNQPVPTRIIDFADVETATLAHQHNQKLQQQLRNQDQK